MVRHGLTDAQWARISALVPGQKSDPGRTGADTRLFVDAVLWIAHTGSPWRDLPDAFGPWYSVYTRFWRWSRRGVWESLFKALANDPDFEYLIIDSTIVRAHQHAAGARGGSKSGYRALARRAEQQNPYRRGRAWKSTALHPHRRPGSRQHPS